MKDYIHFIRSWSLIQNATYHKSLLAGAGQNPYSVYLRQIKYVHMVNFCGLIPGLIQIIRTIDLTNKYIQARDKYIHTINALPTREEGL
jgi:hypothetical protein